MDQNKDILLAIIGAPHGIKGEVRVKSFTGDPIAFADYGKLHDKDGRKYQVINARQSKTVVVTRFKSIDTREKAEALTGTELFVDRAVLPEVEDADEFYMSDLVGLAAVSPDGEKLGDVIEVHDFGAGDILEIRLTGSKPELFPFTREIFPEVDIEGGKIVFVPPEIVSEREEQE
jgi:16S rRNA processing protein RimM